ncbi:MAG TPA: HNH endonuclease signature motif containing protein [Anaeromyxobacter sp.]|nr:HNH endonuclease signature motif containing protein [Anaeromyxobacter sp.]
MNNAPRDLAARLADLLRREHVAMVDFLLALADFDQQRAWRELGYAGLFPFLHRELGLSKAAAFFRMKAAELVRRFPDVVEPLRDGRLCLTSIVELAKVLTPENRDDVLPRFFHCSKQEAKAVSAELAPLEEPPRRTLVTELPREAPAKRVETRLIAAETPSQSVRRGEPVCLEVVNDVKREEVSRPRPRDESVPLTVSLSRLHVTVSRAFLEKLEAARLALSHARPGATVEDVLEAGLELVLAKNAKKRALVSRRRPPAANQPVVSRSDHVPAAIRREVWKRDGGCCQWPIASGGICGSRVRLELDHIVPKGRGGGSTVSNLRILCRAHNVLAARLAYGDEVMDRFTGCAGRAQGR